MDVVFSESPEIELATNKFINVPTIIQWEDVPLMEVGKFAPAGYTTKFAIFHGDGTKIAVVKGSRVHLTKEGEKAKVTLRHPQGMTVCELEGKPIWELRRTSAASLKGWAELHAPEGAFIKVHDSGASALLGDGTQLQVGNVTISNSTFTGQQIGIHVTKQGLAFGVGGGAMHVGNMRIGEDQEVPYTLQAKGASIRFRRHADE